MITLQLTPSEAVKLEMFLRLTTKFREGEAKTYKFLFDEMNNSENPDEKVLSTMKDNADFWKEQCEVMSDIQERISTLLTMPQTQGEDNHDN